MVYLRFLEEGGGGRVKRYFVSEMFWGILIFMGQLKENGNKGRMFQKFRGDKVVFKLNEEGCWEKRNGLIKSVLS